MIVNLFLVAFNLLPAFPMDGGRVLRALLAMRLGRRRATAIAANIGQGMAILFGIVGFLYNPFLIFIAIFVFLGAQAEAGAVEMQSALEGLRVRDGMMTRFRALSTQDTLNRAVEELLAGSQQDFPVLENSAPVGILRRNDLVKALSEGRREATVGEVMCRQCETVDELSPLKQAVESMHARQCASVPVSRGGAVVGLLTLENINEMLMINSALGSGPDTAGARRAAFP
jgi:CBS domain-containing protein